jgi:hypothetical protein
VSALLYICVVATLPIKYSLLVEIFLPNPEAKFPTFTHMKTHLQDWREYSESWQDNIYTYIDRECNIKLGNYSQDGILHYTENNFVTDKILERYGNVTNV